MEGSSRGKGSQKVDRGDRIERTEEGGEGGGDGRVKWTDKMGYPLCHNGVKPDKRSSIRKEGLKLGSRGRNKDGTFIVFKPLSVSFRPDCACFKRTTLSTFWNFQRDRLWIFYLRTLRDVC